MNPMPVLADFQPHLHEKFEIEVQSAGSFQVELIAIDEHSNEQWEGYSVVFQGPTDHIFGQGTHKLKHPVMGEYDLFIVPVFYPQKAGMYYQAIFSRVKQ